MPLFEMKKHDRDFYDEVIRDFIPDTLVDDHSHIYLKEFCFNPAAVQRSAAWPNMIAEDNSAEDLEETYRLLFPGKKVIPVLMGQPHSSYDVGKCNDYVEQYGRQRGYPRLFLTKPEMTAAEFESGILAGGFAGSKVYLNFSPACIPQDEIRIFDFLPHHQLEVLERHGWAVMLHIARPGRLKDPVNLAQLLEIERRYPHVQVVVAHVGRAYAESDVGDAFDLLAKTEHMVFDLSANVNANVFTGLIQAVGPQRILYGTDLPVLRMRAARVVENGVYYNLVPKGLYGDVSNDIHMRELDGEAAAKLTIMIYEQIAAFRTAAERTGLSRQDVADVFCNNACRIFTIGGQPQGLR